MFHAGYLHILPSLALAWTLLAWRGDSGCVLGPGVWCSFGGNGGLGFSCLVDRSGVRGPSSCRRWKDVIIHQAASLCASLAGRFRALENARTDA